MWKYIILSSIFVRARLSRVVSRRLSILGILLDLFCFFGWVAHYCHHEQIVATTFMIDVVQPPYCSYQFADVPLLSGSIPEFLKKKKRRKS